MLHLGKGATDIFPGHSLEVELHHAYHSTEKLLILSNHKMPNVIYKPRARVRKKPIPHNKYNLISRSIWAKERAACWIMIYSQKVVYLTRLYRGTHLQTNLAASFVTRTRATTEVERSVRNRFLNDGAT